MENEIRKYYEGFIEKYKKSRPLYKNFNKILKKIFKHLVKGCSTEFIIDGELKSVSEFADQMTQLGEDYLKPLEELTDLCVLNVSLSNLDEVEAVCDLIEKNFLIITKDGESNLEGFESYKLLSRSKSYVIQLNPKSDIYKRLEMYIPDEIFNLRAKIRISTFLSHAWEANQNIILTKGRFNVPDPYKIELSRVSALLDIADDSLNNIMLKISEYESSYGAYMSPENIKKEIERLEIVLAADERKYEVAYSIAKLAMAINDMDKSINIINSIMNNNKQWKKIPDIKAASILRDLGISTYKKYKKNPFSKNFIQGQTYLESAIQRDAKNSDAWSSLGGSYKEQNNYERALNYYRQALTVNPGDPYPLGNFLILTLQQTGNLVHIERNRAMIEKGIEKRLRQIEVMVDIPWAFFDIGLFSLLLGEVSNSIDYYLKAIKHSQDLWMIETTCNTLDTIKIVHKQINGIKNIRDLLLLGIAFHPNVVQKTAKQIQEVRAKLDRDLEQVENIFGDSVVIIAGGTDESVERNIQKYRDNLIKAFNNYKGTIISGGTKSGISGITGDIQERYSEKINTIGYIPSYLPANIEIDKRYSTVHLTDEKVFSVREVLQYWYDILKAKIDPTKVKLIGINGGKISAFEYRVAIVFGAQVGIIENSGRAADELINDSSWREVVQKGQEYKTQRLFKILKNNSDDINDFLTKPFIVDPDIENIQKILIQHRESGVDMYELSFLTQDIDNTIFTGFLTALDHIAREALKVGEILSIKFREGYLMGGLFSNRDFKVVFLLNESPSKSLEKNIIKFINEVEESLNDEFQKLYKGCQGYRGGDDMNNILSKNFGSEILRLIPKKIDSESLTE